VTAGLAFLGPSAGAALGGVLAGRLATSRPPVLVMGLTSVLAAVSLAALAVSHAWAVYLPALTACGLTLGLVYAFTTVATQAVVRPERAGEAAGVTLTALVTLAGVGIAVSGTVLEMLQRPGLSPSGAVGAIVEVPASLLPACALVLVIARASKSGPRSW
jgi:MFS family permease